jgi:N-acetylated-alpha-linked acidic dipeptidase
MTELHGNMLHGVDASRAFIVSVLPGDVNHSTTPLPCVFYKLNWHREFIMRVQQLSVLAAFASSASACQRDFNLEARHTHRKPLVKRNDQWPPILNDHETLLAGYGKDAAQWTADRWNENGVDAHLSEYHVFLRYPVSASLQHTSASGEVSEVNLKEDVLEEDDVTGLDVISQQTWLGYSPTGNASAEYVYVG